jgi:protein-disulfide isomerase
MRTGLLLAAAGVALVAVPAAAAPAHKRPVHHGAAAAPHDWSRSVVATGAGGFRMGNPAAPVKLIEYGSLACPHCRHFAESGYRPLVQRYVRSGRVSYEFRTLIINGPDISISLLARCAGPAVFFPMAEAVYAAQPQWQQKFAVLTAAQKAEIEKLSDAQRMVRFAQIGGFAQISARFGVPPVRARQCLADPAGLKRVLGIAEAAGKMGVEHTPTFFVNGKMTEAATWEELEPLIRQAGG